MASLAWEQRFANKGQLNLDLDYLVYNNRNDHDNLNNYSFKNPDSVANEKLRVEKQSLIKIYVARLGYSKPLNGKTTLETGAKLTISNLENKLQVNAFRSNQTTPYSQTYSKYNLTDNAIALYGNLKSQLSKKYTLEAGLRLESIDVLLQNDSNQKVFAADSWNLFPNVAITYRPAAGSSLTLSYNRRINRPSYNEIAPFVLFMDPTTYFTGNPSLLPAITNTIRLGYNMRQYAFSLQYSHDKNFIAAYQGRVIEGTSTFYTSPENIKNQSFTTFSVSFPLTITRWWSSYQNISLAHQYVNAKFQNNTLNLYRLKPSLFISENLNFGNGFAGEITGFYFASSFGGIVLNGAFSGLSLGVKKKLSKDAGVFALDVSDVFWLGKFRQTNVYKQLNLNVHYRYREEPRVIRLTYTRSFGNKKMKPVSPRTVGSEAEQSRIKL
jgi:outer membrane receptor protein involved in Fe transport